jgi:hypothetical protein
VHAVGEVGLEVANEFREPVGDDFGMEIAMAIAEDFVAVGIMAEEAFSEVADGQAGGDEAAEEGGSGACGEGAMRGEFVLVILPDGSADTPSGGDEGHQVFDGGFGGTLRDRGGRDRAARAGGENGVIPGIRCNEHRLSPLFY